MNKENKDRRITFRLTDAELETLESDAKTNGFPDMSTYIRSRITDKVDRVFYDPEMTDAVRSCRSDIRALVQDVDRVRRHVDATDTAGREELGEIHATVKAIYHRMDDVESVLSAYSKGVLAHGNNETAPD